MKLYSYTTANYACGYLPDRRARSEVLVGRQPGLAAAKLTADPDAAAATAAAEPPGHSNRISPEQFDALLAHGFRRSGLFIYRPACGSCMSCVATRVPVAGFTPSRSQRRAWQRHHSLTVQVLPLQFSAEHLALYQRYQTSRHDTPQTDASQADAPADNSAGSTADNTGSAANENSPEAYRDFICQSRVQTVLLEFRERGALKMVSVVDVSQNALSAVYTFYEPHHAETHTQPKASYGTYSVLWQIEWARQLELSHVYLGFWLEQSPKMRYKANFQPQQRLSAAGLWV